MHCMPWRGMSLVLLCACVHVSLHSLPALCLKVLQACVGCMDAVANKVTHNYKLVADCFQKFYGKCITSFAVPPVMGFLSVVVYVCKIMLQGIYSHHPIDPLAALIHPVFLERVRMLHSRDQQSPQLASQRSLLLRSLFVVSLMCRHFDFDQVAMEVPLPDLVSGAVGAQHQQHAAWQCEAGTVDVSAAAVLCCLHAQTSISLLWSCCAMYVCFVLVLPFCV